MVPTCPWEHELINPAGWPMRLYPWWRAGLVDAVHGQPLGADRHLTAVACSFIALKLLDRVVGWAWCFSLGLGVKLALGSTHRRLFGWPQSTFNSKVCTDGRICDPPRWIRSKRRVHTWDGPPGLLAAWVVVSSLASTALVVCNLRLRFGASLCAVRMAQCNSRGYLDH